MKSEFQFFMHPHDEAEFIRFAAADASLSPLASHEGAVDCPRPGLQFWRSAFSGHLLTAGRIAVLSADPEAVALYRRWRRWLRARYSNPLVCYNETFAADKRRVAPAKFLWVGPHAIRWLAANPEHTFRQFARGTVIFTLPDRLT